MKAKDMKNTGEIKIPILNNEYQVIVVFGDNKAVSKCLKRHGFKDCNFEYGTDRAVTIYEEETNPVIALPRKPRTPEEIGNLSHEAVHAVKYLFDFIGEESIDEVFAHSVGAIVREALS
jgi:hypothetical protein